MKHVPRDRTFVYYFQRQPDGTCAGIRIGRTHAGVVAGETGNPELMQVRGRNHRIPVADDESTEEFLNVRGPLADEHPELERLLTGELDFEDATTLR